jgi:uncharacterized glyoxalase superfamily protein PhnB
MTTTLVPYLSYPEAPAAIAWLEAIGFRVVTRQDDDSGGVLHAELRLDDAIIMLASDDQRYVISPLIEQSSGAGLYLATDDVDAIYAAALEAGAQSVFPPEDTEWGTRRARVLDPAGREWSFGSHRPGIGW